ncbi:hypothetical protein FA15DRAFT_675514 [Coprinopsis marcescibilis]|uniref:Uncharacterized protein n=1 Tax=Coprinopsis marcescibilis TaxID=230819 RepID=A0A5C3KED5_COPMA|nr:hypothetical protein FA15DRAFT_675514 [Coprinopsis marcescibilis]
MTFDNPKHFQLDEEDGGAEWAAIVPGGDGIVYLGPEKHPYTISLFHQLRCLDIIRQETIKDRQPDEGPSDLGRHCLNYIRQMVTCRGDLEIESFQFASHKNPIDQRGVYECKDWEAVYHEVEKNQAEYRGGV